MWKKQVTITLSNIKLDSQYYPVHENILCLLKLHVLESLLFCEEIFFYCITNYKINQESNTALYTIIWIYQYPPQFIYIYLYIYYFI